MLKEKLNLGLSKRLEQQSTMLQTGYFRALAQEIISSVLDEALPQFKKELSAEMNKMASEHLRTMVAPEGRPGKNAEPEEVVPLVLSKLPKQELESAEKIAKKLNTLFEAIDWKVIRGLKKEFAKASGPKQSGGGGMGNIQHETKAVSSATTTVATTYSIAGGGYAIWAYYNGQLIMRGTHYTVSGKTLTLTFTPQDNTSIDIIYIR